MLLFSLGGGVGGKMEEEDTMLDKADSSSDSSNFHVSLDPAMLSAGVRGWPYCHLELLEMASLLRHHSSPVSFCS